MTRSCLAGGRAISEFTKTDWILAEFLGMGLAPVFVVLGIVAKNAADAHDGEDSTDQRV
ncbi:MAG TPA: hypothetical protein VEN79_01415 [Terriglobia bacterium]|nr:hypothetical protein [Terriglobia bacterium]